MKGSQGLEALAALCGGASKAPDNEPSQQNDCSQQSTQTSQLIGNNNNAAGTQSQVSISPQLEHFANSSVAFNRSKGEPNVGQQNQALNQINPQVAALLKAGLSQQNISNNIPSNDGAMALQQMVYLNLLQNQNNVSNMLNQQQQQQQASTQFVDQNALAMVLALQQQQAVQHEAGMCRKHLFLFRNPVIQNCLMAYDVDFYYSLHLSFSATFAVVAEHLPSSSMTLINTIIAHKSNFILNV